MNCLGRAAYSIVEVLVVIGIIGLLVGILLPAVQNVRAAAARTQCLNNMRQIGIALHNYESQHRRFPPGMVQFPPVGGSAHYAALSWRAPLLPHLEQESLWAQTVTACGIDPIAYHDPPHVGNATVISLFVCPADGRLSRPLHDIETGLTGAYTSYLAVEASYPGSKYHPEYAGVFDYPKGTTFSEIRDGTSNTLAVGERPPPITLENGWWYSAVCAYAGGAKTGPCRGPAVGLTIGYPENAAYEGTCYGPFSFGPGRLDNPCDRFHFWSLHSGGANFLFADGSTRFIGYSAKTIMPALATRAGGETVLLPD